MKHKDTPADEELKAAEPAKEPVEAPKEEPDYYDQLLRLKAEFENYRKRVDREKPELVRYGHSGLVTGDDDSVVGYAGVILSP